MYLVVGCGAFCAVTQGNRNPTDRLIRLKYTPRSSGNEDRTLFPHTGVTITAAAAAAAASGGEGAASGSVNMGIGGKTLSALRPVVLVGKGVCYDTGGTVRSENREGGNKGDEVKPLFSSSHCKSHPQEYSIFTRSYNFYPFLVVLPSIFLFFLFSSIFLNIFSLTFIYKMHFILIYLFFLLSTRAPRHQFEVCFKHENNETRYGRVCSSSRHFPSTFTDRHFKQFLIIIIIIILPSIIFFITFIFEQI